jgi:hypothetical protein
MEENIFLYTACNKLFSLETEAPAQKHISKRIQKRNNLNLKVLVILISHTFLQQGCDLLSSNPDLELKLTLDRFSYEVGDTLTGRFEAKNISDEENSYRFRSTCQHDIRIIDSERNYNEYPKICGQAFTTLSLKPGESKSYVLLVYLIDKNYQNLNSGRYTIQAFLEEGHSDIVEKSIVIN